MEADISGPQRKVKVSWVRPVGAEPGVEGIYVRDGVSLPFVVHREWLAPAGYYVEQWFIVEPQTREVFYEGPAVERFVWGLQGLTAFEDRVETPVPLAPGRYQVVFALGALAGGELDIEVAQAPTASAA